MRADIPQEIEKQDIKDLPKISFDGEIVVVEDVQYVTDAVEYLRQFSILGFDTETRPSFKKGVSNQHKVALLQLYADNRAYLFRLNKIGLPESLAELLADQHVLKTGAAVHDDIKALKELTYFDEGGFVDVQNLAAELEIEVRSLRRLTAMFFKGRLSKTQQLSNWEAEKLSEAQCVYAATDAWISYKLYCELFSYMK